MILPTLPPKEANAKVKEAAVIKPKSPLSSPLKHERHYIPNIKDSSSQEGEMKQHSFLEQNPLQLSHQITSEIIGAEIAEKVLGRRDSRGDGSSSENTSTSATGSPKLTPDSILMDSYNHSLKMDKDGLFKKKNVPIPVKRDTWMRQRLLKQGSGDSDRGYRNYRGHAEGQEIKAEGERDGFVIPWDTRFHYPNESGAVMVDDEYQARMTPPYNNYWQMDPTSGQFYSIYDMSHSYPPAADNSTYVYNRNPGAEVPPIHHNHIMKTVMDTNTSHHNFGYSTLPNPTPVICNNPGTIPRRLGTASPRLKRSQCLSVQAPLHGTPQEYHLIPHQPANLRPTLPNSSPRPGRSPSPGIENRVSVQYSSQPYQKFPSHYQPSYPVQGYPITTQPVNASQFPPPPPNVHPPYHSNYQNPPPVYPTLPPSPRMKHVGHSYGTSAMDDSALVSRPYPMVPVANVHKSTYYPSNAQGDNLDPIYHHRLQPSANPEDFEKVQDAEYGVAPSGSLHYRSGSIPAQIQNIESCDVQHLNRSVPSINIIPSTSPPQTTYMTNAENWRGDTSNIISAKPASESSSVIHSNATKPEISTSPINRTDSYNSKFDEKQLTVDQGRTETKVKNLVMIMIMMLPLK
ncbi:hypothetical protein CEXT_786151 [Caerostris extrusa]|uniref:Enamelin n=1 Tax=Caerostris extrusa TaxID=172846 RepID=A0AAV4V0X3_CAEEX|nr:hypothetical protein CEXT_786151 [Caerostris extrusa]